MDTNRDVMTIRLNDGRVFENVPICRKFVERLRGFLFRKDLTQGEMLFFPCCSSVHTFFMRKNLRVLFLDEKMRLVCEIKNMRPSRIAFSRNAKNVLEIVL
jgi:uncharacterized membrane protein (UPF0127 family)